MNKFQFKSSNINPLQIPINEKYKEKIFNLASSHELSELEDFITTNSISLKLKNDKNETITHVLLKGESTILEDELLRCMKFLVERGAPISSIDSYYLTPLFICIDKKYPKIFKYLLEKGASMDINTYDNLNILHEIAKSEHTIFNEKGIQDLIPEKLPKIKMEGYKEVYKKINEVIAIKDLIGPVGLVQNNIIEGLKKFKSIAGQFYYDNEREDFNNILLIEDFKNTGDIEQKKDLFIKLKDQLKYFYDDTENIDEVKLKNELDQQIQKNITDLNNEITQTKMHQLNNNLLSAIKNLARSLELSIHYFFLKDPENTYIATDVVIAIAERARKRAGAGAQIAAINNALSNTDVVREAVQAIKAATIEAKKENNIAKNIIDIIKRNIINEVVRRGPRAVSGRRGTVHSNLKNIRDQINRLMSTEPNPVIYSRTNNIIKPAQQAAIVRSPIIIELENINFNNILNNINNVNLHEIVLLIYNVKAYIYIAINTIINNPDYTSLIGAQRIQAIAIVQKAIRATVYAVLYARNKTVILPQAPPLLPVPELANMAAVYTAVDANVLAGITQAAGTLNINQEEIQKAFTDPVVAIEVVVFATRQIVNGVINSVSNVTGETMIAAIKEALENIEASKENIDMIIEIAKQAGADTAAINTILSNTNVVREALLAIKATTIEAKKEKYITNDIINIIKNNIATAVANAGATAGTMGTVSTTLNNIKDEIKKLMSNAQNVQNRTNNIIDSILGAINSVPSLVFQDGRTFDLAIQTNIIKANLHDIIIKINIVNAYIYNAIYTIINDVNLSQSQKIQVIAIAQKAIRDTVYTVLYARNKTVILPQAPPLLPAPAPELANMAAVYTAVDANVLAGITQAAGALNINQEEIQKAFIDPVIPIEAVVWTANLIVSGVLNNVPNVTGEIMIAALSEALKQPQIIPQNFKNNDYNELIKSYKLINIPQKYINYNIPYNYININIKESVDLINYKLPEGDRSYCIDYFNLLYTFNEYVKDNYNPIIINNDIFTLYQCIQQIYKYNYIIYIFEKEKEKILRLKDSYITNINNNINLKKTINELFDNNYDEFVNNINLIREQLEKIKKLANDYIDNYNKLNGYEKYKNPDGNNIKIGIYPKIEFPTEIKHTLGDENAIIAKCDKDYITYNENKNDFFHNFVLYFQDIGKNGVNNTLLNSIPQPIDYNIDITNYETNIIDKAYKLYFYDSRFLKLEKQKIIQQLLLDKEISNIIIPKYEYYKNDIANNFNDIIKNMILNEILEEKFNSFLVMEINKFFILNISTLTPNLEYEHEIIEPNYINIYSKLNGFNFKSILIPNYEFKNNKFLSITKNRFLKCILYFDTNYFKQTNLKELKYYKDNKFIEQIQASKFKTLLNNTDIKGWTPIYYAIDGNNYKVINKMLSIRKEILTHHDHKKISPIKLCINKQLQHLNYLLDEDNNIHFLNNYIDMLRNELKINNVLIPLNINAVFIITLFIQNNIFNIKQALPDEIQHLDNNNSRKIQINKEYNNIRKTRHDHFNYSDNKINNELDKIKREYTKKDNLDYNYADADETNSILKKYYKKAKDLENKDFGLYGTYWNNTKKYNRLIHIKTSKDLKTKLEELINLETNNTFQKSAIQQQITDLTSIKNKLEHYLSFINIRFNANKNNAYDVFLNKIYVHVLANIIGVDFYLRMEELIIHNYISLNININNTVKEQLKILNKLLINNKLDDTNINYLYITAEKNPELVLKDKIKEILKNIFIANDIEIINTFETKVYPNYKELYKITYKYLQMFISNYHKFIYNQYHGLEILLLLLDKLE